MYRTAADIPGQSTDQLTLKVPGPSCLFCAIGMLVHQKEYVQRQPWTGDDCKSSSEVLHPLNVPMVPQVLSYIVHCFDFETNF